MELILTFLVLYLIGVSLYTIILRNSPTNKNVPHFEYWSTIKDGMKGIGIGFLVVAAILVLISLISNNLV